MTQEGGTMRKSSSFEPLATRNQNSSSEGEEQDSPQLGTRLGGRIKSSSMSPLKSGTMISDSPPPEEGQPEIEPGTGAYLKPESEDDVFVDRFPGDFPPEEDNGEQAQWPKSPQEMRQSRELALVESSHNAPVDPQEILPPTACIFVANLTQSVKDEVLLNEITRIFNRFGNVWVKIRRDNRQMPFAFCQFANDEDAERAVEEGKGMVIFGRPCRTEKAKANSVFIIHKWSGDPISETEAFEFLKPVGAISNIDMMEEMMQREMGLPPAAIVYFKMYDSRRDVLKYARGQKRYVVIPYEPKRSSTPGSVPSHGDQARKTQYEIDRRSAYFGNLPLDMTDSELREIAASCGLVRQVTLNRKPYRGGAGETVFGFVEFMHDSSVDDVVRNFNTKNLRGFIISVQQKQSRSLETTRSTPHGSSPAPRANTSYGGMTPTGRSGYDRGYRSTPLGSAGYGRGGGTPARYSSYGRGSGPSQAGPSNQGRGFNPSPAGPSNYGRGSGSWGRTTGRTAYSSTGPSYAGPSRTPIRGHFNTPQQAGLSASRGPRRMPIPAIPERVSSARHSQARMLPSAAPKDDEGSTPKGKGKAPMRPYQLPTQADNKDSAASPEADKTVSEEKADLLIDFQVKDDTESEKVHDNKEAEVATKAEDKPKSSHQTGDDAAKKVEQKDSAKIESGTKKESQDEQKEEKPFNPPKAPRAHYAPSPPGPYFPTSHPSYAMPFGYMAPQMPAYGEPGILYPAPGPFAPNLHPAVLNSFMGYPPGFLWSDAYGNPMYTGMGPSGQMPPPLPPVAGPPPTPTRSGGSSSAGKSKVSGPSPGTSSGESGDSANESSNDSPKKSPKASPAAPSEASSKGASEASPEASPETPSKAAKDDDSTKTIGDDENSPAGSGDETE